MIDAIIEGNFPYPYRTGEDEEEERLRGNIKAPVGKWRQIWSNTTYLVKTGFYNTFTGKTAFPQRSGHRSCGSMPGRSSWATAAMT